MPTPDHLRRVAGSIRQDLDHTRRGFTTVDRMELTRRVRQVSGQSTTRIKAGMAADLEDALAAGGLRCFPSLTETTTGDVVRIFRAGSVVGELIDAVLVPSPDHDRTLAEALSKLKGTWEWDRETSSDEPSVSDVIREVLPREKQLAYVASLDDPDLATT